LDSVFQQLASCLLLLPNHANHSGFLRKDLVLDRALNVLVFIQLIKFFVRRHLEERHVTQLKIAGIEFEIDRLVSDWIVL